MNSVLLAFLSMSLSGTLLALLLFALRPALRGRLSHRWHYYVWLIVVLRLLLPLGPQQSPMTRLVDNVRNLAVSSAVQDPAPAAAGNAAAPTPTGDTAPTDSDTAAGNTAPTAEAQQHTGALRELAGSLWLLWLAGAFALLVKKISGYHAFLGYIKAGCRPVERGPAAEQYRDLCAQLHIRRPPALMSNTLAAAPMLVGVFRPFIVLPDIGDEEETAAMILRHELLHYRRGDIFYKWLAQLAACLHWFNPMVYPVLRALNRDCELSCDEAVIRAMDEEQKYRYGETLLTTIKPDPGYSNAIVSITLNEDTQKLKERLDAIMTYKGKSRAATAVSLLLAAVLAMGALLTGVYAAPPAQKAAAPDAQPIYSELDGYLQSSPHWQDHLARGGDATNQWPDYIAMSFEGASGEPVGCSFTVPEDTFVRLTVRYRSGDLHIAVENSTRRSPFDMSDIRSDSIHSFVIEGSHAPYFLAAYATNFHGDVLLEKLDEDPGNPGATSSESTNIQSAPNDAGNVDDPQITSVDNWLYTPADYLSTLPYWDNTGTFRNWPYYIGVQIGVTSSDDNRADGGQVLELAVDTPTTAVLSAHTVTGTFGVRIEGPGGEELFNQPLIISAQYRIRFAEPGTYRVEYSFYDYSGRMILENEQYTATFQNVNFGMVHGDGPEPDAIAEELTEPAGNDLPYDPAGKSTDVDYAALHIMQYAGSWEITELMLPYMTVDGINAVVALYNGKNPAAPRTASDYYYLATPGRADTDTICYQIGELTGSNWVYISPLFPYMTNGGIDRVIALYNQRTGNRLSAAAYYN